MDDHRFPTTYATITPDITRDIAFQRPLEVPPRNPTRNLSLLRYVIYARKSSEEKSRQVQSIEDQIAAVRPLIEQGNLHIVATLTESQSAKEPGRPVFGRMLEMIQKGEADAILCWHLNRLTRNEIDSGSIRWLLRQGTIREIVTPTRTYRPEDNALITAVESAMGEQFIVELMANTRRGVLSKVDKGWFPGHVPPGYRNDVLTHTIVRDPLRWPLIRRAWDEMLSGQVTVPQLALKMGHDWGYRSGRGASRGMAKNTLYRIFTNPFYTGVFSWSGSLHAGKHEPMVTTEEFQAAQRLLKRGEGHPECRHRKHRFAYSGLIACDHCGHTVCADRKRKVLKYTGEERYHIYYACSQTGYRCPVSGRLREAEVEKTIVSTLESIRLPNDFLTYAEQVMERERQEKKRLVEATMDAQTQAIQERNRESDELLTLRLRGLIDDEEYRRRKERLLRERDSLLLDNRLQAETRGSLAALRASEQVVRFCATELKDCSEGFAGPNIPAKAVVLRELGTRFVLRQRRLVVELPELLGVVREWKREQAWSDDSLEPMKIGSGRGKSASFVLSSSIWGGLWAAIRDKAEGAVAHPSGLSGGGES